MARSTVTITVKLDLGPVAEEIDDLVAKVQFLVDWAAHMGHLEDGCFTFPDGDTWASR